MKIKTSYWPKPTPVRSFDWQAVTDDYDGPGSPIGHGATEQEAITDLMEQLEDIDDEDAHSQFGVGA